MRIPTVHTAVRRSSLLLLFCLLLLPSLLTAQPYRTFEDSTRGEAVVPKHFGHEPFPIGIYYYHYNFNRPVTDMWEYAAAVGMDHIYVTVAKHLDVKYNLDMWDRYHELLDAAPAGIGVLPITAYEQFSGISMADMIARSRTVVFYPFDSSQLGGIANTGMVFRYVNTTPDIDRFMSWQYDTSVINENHGILGHEQTIPRREAIYGLGMAGDTVASGIAFDYRSGQSQRWNSTHDGSGWVQTSSPINSSGIFDGVNFSDQYHPREPHFITITGHLFANGPASLDDTLLQINVYYEVDRGSQYIDSSQLGLHDTLRTPLTADTNLRFHYSTLYYTKEDIFPENPSEPDWNAHRSASERISFRQEGMPGPTALNVTARSIDLEVIYLGGEPMALHSVAIRDSAAEMVLGEGTAHGIFRAAFLAQRK